MSAPQPPSPPKWAMEAARAVFDFDQWPPSLDAPRDQETQILATIITRHHAAAQAETVSLLEEAIHRLRESNNCMDASQDLPEGPGCTRDPNTCGVKYCGWPNRCETDEPAPLAGGTEILPSTAPAEVAAGCKEGRPVSPATGEREAELRRLIQRILFHQNNDPRFVSLNHITGEFIAALTPLLDRREGELADVRIDRDNMAHDLKNLRDLLGCDGSDWPQLKAAVAALRTLVAKQKEVLQCAKKELQDDYEADMFSMNGNRDYSAGMAREFVSWLTDTIALTPSSIADELAAKDALIADRKAKICDMGTVQVELRAQLTSAQSALREAEAARGEDSKRLDWLEANGRTVSEYDGRWEIEGTGHAYNSCRAAIDAARAQEAKP